MMLMVRVMARTLRISGVWLLASCVLSTASTAQEYGKADGDAPGDAAVQRYLKTRSSEVPARFLEGIETASEWTRRRPELLEQYLYMLGLSPRPERSPLKATITGRVKGDGYVVDLLHYQSRPRLYVTANLYRPAVTPADRRLPAILYVCGHSPRPRNGNKTAFQSHGIWFARHGYICLVVDTLRLGEIAAIHHGTYREGRWWWHSRGYTSAGVECWNGVRGVDYLISRPDVDPQRIGVTGISGGGAATFWVAAADERVRVAVPVSGMADLPSYVGNRVINGHCDCMFLYNTFRWPWTNIAALIAPRPQLFVNSHRDAIFPMDANERISNRLESLYSLFGASDRFDTLVSRGGHAYREDIRRGVYRFLNIYLKNDASAVEDSEVDLVTGRGDSTQHPIPPESLRVFKTDDDIPDDELNTTIDRHFVPVAKVELPATGDFQKWRAGLLAELSRVSFAPRIGYTAKGELLDPADGGPVTRLTLPRASQSARWVMLVPESAESSQPGEARLAKILAEGKEAVVVCHPRGLGETRWTRRDPPNYVERSHVLLGFTADAARVRDIAAAAAHAARSTERRRIHVAGSGSAGVLAAYAALVEDLIDEVTLVAPPASHMDEGAPQLLNVLRVCDIPEALGMLAPRKLTLIDAPAALTERVRAIYRAAGAGLQLTIAESEKN